MTHSWEDIKRREGENGGGGEARNTEQFPPAELSLAAARKLMGQTRGHMKVARRYDGISQSWRVYGTLEPQDGPNFEFELEGAELDEVAYALVDALQKCGFSTEEAL